MKIKITDQILGYDGEPIRETKESDILTYRAVISASINARAEGEVFTADLTSKIYAISKKIWAAADVDLTVAERALIEERLIKVCSSPLIIGRVSDLLDGATDEAPTE